MRLGLGLLLEALDTARALKRSKWDFAVEIHALRSAGLDWHDLRALICQGLVEHALETTRASARRRSFRGRRTPRLFPQSCFVLSDWGLVATARLSTRRLRKSASRFALPTVRPVWDSARRELRVNDVVVKAFRQPAKNQQSILSAFQEEGWPARIDNPISGADDGNARERLHNTIKRLNRQLHPILRFGTDGTSEGVVWRMQTQAHRERTESAP
jgi:hypothetical protein